MFSPVVQAVLQMGFEQAPVERLVQSRFLHNSHCYTSVSDLVADVLQAEEEGRQNNDNKGAESIHCLKKNRHKTDIFLLCNLVLLSA